MPNKKHEPTIYDKIGWYRIFMEWSMATLAGKIGLEYSVVRRTLIGETVPFDYNAVKFQKYFNEHEEAINEAYDAITAGLKKD